VRTRCCACSGGPAASWRPLQSPLRRWFWLAPPTGGMPKEQNLPRD